MPKLKFRLVVDNGESSVTLYRAGETFDANAGHHNWEAIQAALLADDESVFDLIRPENMIRRALSERVSVANGRLYLDHDEVNDALSQHIVRLVGEKSSVDAWVKFLENIQANPNNYSREHLFRHLQTYNYSITDDGYLIAYKGVRENETHGYVSCMSGPAIVNGSIHEGGPVPNSIGNVVEMPRSDVTFDPNRTCSVGLHVADWQYASQMGPGPVLEVHVSPRDVVSVPNDHGDAKVRVCRYKVVAELTEPHKRAVVVSKTKPAPHVKLSDETAKVVNVPPTQESSVSATATRYRYPSPAKFDELVRKAKAQKKGAVRYIQSRTTWSLIPGRGDGSDRKDWSV